MGWPIVGEQNGFAAVGHYQNRWPAGTAWYGPLVIASHVLTLFSILQRIFHSPFPGPWPKRFFCP
jgi:hypothetical protein